jgi:hypothetical protein
LQDRADSYSEPFSITINRFDGTNVTISNQHHGRHHGFDAVEP